MSRNTCTFETHNPEETRNLARHLAPRLRRGDVIALEGDLGAGKTTFTQGLAAGLGIEEPVDSPTFTLIKEYEGGRLPLYHMDVYRLNHPTEELGWDEYFYGDGVTLVEWADRIEPMLPGELIRIEVSRHQESDVRKIRIEPPAGETERICGGLGRLDNHETAGD
ncbi:tRNA (adenosine(37)-N6)-threonylcarbamoyltransferase complex ATPase subunit type 1 TsaE [Melghirimyces profundicolus]|nr:tRNA (adenosine(37)-N6)-threonylcarbamoyltransferase complex ATPase subunit type 1 TsaE [Melghirimyces profundicolus]